MVGPTRELGVIRKILSSGIGGVEAGAMDVAVKLGLNCGGWVPKGQPNPTAAYRLKENDSPAVNDAVERNVIDSDGTLLITLGRKNDPIKYAIQMTLKHQRQLLHLDLREYPIFEAGSMISSWVAVQFIHTVYVTGPTSAEEEKLYQQTQKVLETAIYLGMVKSGAHPKTSGGQVDVSSKRQAQYPRTVAQALEQLKAVLPLKDRILMANMQAHEIEHLHSGLSEYIKQNFGLYAGNTPLLQACAQAGQIIRPLPDEAAAVILRALWKDLQATHKLRIIK